MKFILSFSVKYCNDIVISWKEIAIEWSVVLSVYNGTCRELI